MDSLLAHFGFEIRLADHTMLEDSPTHTDADLRAQDGILRQSQVDAQGFFSTDGRQGHRCPKSRGEAFPTGLLSKARTRDGCFTLTHRFTHPGAGFTHPGAWA